MTNAPSISRATLWLLHLDKDGVLRATPHTYYCADLSSLGIATMSGGSCIIC